ncbi:MAG: glycosyltransferase family 4 protein [Armatimonadia bacterium]
MNILHVITPRHYSGTEHTMVYLCEGLRARGHNVVVACKHNAEMMGELEKRGIEAHALPISGKANVLAPLRLARFARKMQADVIHTHLSTGSLWGSLAGKLAGIPVVAKVAALNSKTCFTLADHIVTCSGGVREHMARQGMPLERMEVLYNGLPTAQFEGLRSGAEMREELGLPAQAPVIGVVAHLSEKKGQMVIVEALPTLLKQFPDLVYVLVGRDYGMQEKLQARARELGVERAVRMLGFRIDAVQIMAAMDLVMLPSIAKEGLGIVLIEAGFMGKPVIGSDAPGIDEVVVHGETGLLARPGDAEEWGKAIERILAVPELAARYGEAGRKRAYEVFSLETMAERAEQIYLKLIESKRKAPRRAA